jgi:cytochrome b pre-mRNA-processing protein 3
MAGLLGIRTSRGTGRHEPAGTALYAAAVAAARDPWLYRVLGVPDTLDGRFDLVALHAFLLIHRLQDAPDPGPALAQAVFDAMFSDMDLSVGKLMCAISESFHVRAKFYATAILATDHGALEAALARNVWRGAAPEGAARSLARIVLAQTAHLAGQPMAALGSGAVALLSAAEASG